MLSHCYSLEIVHFWSLSITWTLFLKWLLLFPLFPFLWTVASLAGCFVDVHVLLLFLQFIMMKVISQWMLFPRGLQFLHSFPFFIDMLSFFNLIHFSRVFTMGYAVFKYDLVKRSNLHISPCWTIYMKCDWSHTGPVAKASLTRVRLIWTLLEGKINFRQAQNTMADFH